MYIYILNYLRIEGDIRVVHLHNDLHRVHHSLRFPELHGNLRRRGNHFQEVRYRAGRHHPQVADLVAADITDV